VKTLPVHNKYKQKTNKISILMNINKINKI
jgi:hypothetical protein